MSRDQIQKQPRVRASLLVNTRRCHTFIQTHKTSHARTDTHSRKNASPPPAPPPSNTHTHRLRFSLAENQQLCPFCVDTNEDKINVMCSSYADCTVSLCACVVFSWNIYLCFPPGHFFPSNLMFAYMIVGVCDVL